jgi:hypothetical protein
MFNLFKKKKIQVKFFLIKKFYTIEEIIFTDNKNIYSIFEYYKYSNGDLDRYPINNMFYGEYKCIVIKHNNNSRIIGFENISDAELLYNKLVEKQQKIDEDNNRYITRTNIIKP